MKTLSKIYSVVALLGSISCLGSAAPILLHYEIGNHVFGDSHRPTESTDDLTTYTLVNFKSPEDVDGCGIIQVGLWNSGQFTLRKNYESCYFIMDVSTDPKVDNNAHRLWLYQFWLNQPAPHGLVRYPTMLAAQQAVPDYLAEKQRLAHEQAMQQCKVGLEDVVVRSGATRLPYVGEVIPHKATSMWGSCVIS